MKALMKCWEAACTSCNRTSRIFTIDPSPGEVRCHHCGAPAICKEAPK